MKTLRSTLALGIALSMILLAPGGAAWAQVAEIAGRGAPASGAVSAAAGSIAPVNGSAALAPGLSLTALSPAFSAPSAFANPAAAPMSASASASAVLSAASAAPISAAAAAAAPAVQSSPAASALDGVRRELPEFSKMSSGDSKGAASADFLTRVGEVFHPAPALSQALAPAASDGKSQASPLSRYRASPSNSPAVSKIERAPVARSIAAPLFAAAAAFGVAAGHGVSLLQPLLTLPLVMLSVILHEIGHAKVAKALGDPTAANQGRASFNPKTWLKHVDPLMTLVVPIATYFSSGMIFGGAKPLPINTAYFKDPSRGMAKVALAGPAVNFALAAVGALAYVGAVAVGLPAIVVGSLTGFVFINTVLGIFNLMPIPPLDGGHILLAALPQGPAQRVRAFYARIGMLGMLPIIGIALLGGGAIMAAAAALTHLLIGVSLTLTGVQLASAALPTVAALGMAIGSLKAKPVAPLSADPDEPSATGLAAGGVEAPVDLVVVFSPEIRLTKDLHLSSVDPRSGNYVQAYQAVQSSLLSQLSAVGLSPEALAAYDATPIASYRRINAATVRVDAAKASEFEAALLEQGHKVYPNFLKRGAALDDILKSLTASANDGALVISNPWAAGDGDPASPDSALIEKLAAEGHMMVFDGAGAPASVRYKDSAAALTRADGSVSDALKLLLIAFGVTAKGAKLDAIAAAVATAGNGTLDLTAAYESLYGKFNPGGVPPTAVARYQALLADENSAWDYLDPQSEFNRAGLKADDEFVESVMKDFEKAHSARAALETEFPGIAYHAAGSVARFFMRAPVPAYAAEYRRLSAKIRDNDARRKEYLGRLPGGPGVREELLEHYYRSVAPEFDADEAAMRALLRSYPNAKYEASSPIRRLYLRLTGQGPKS